MLQVPTGPIIKMEVTPDIAEKIRFLAESGVFALETGNAQINCVNGEIKSVKLEMYRYAQKVDSAAKNYDIFVK